METIEERAQQSAGVKDFDALRLKTFNFCFQTGYIEGATDQQAVFDNLPKVKAWIVKTKHEANVLIISYDKPKKDKDEWCVTNGTKTQIADKELPEGYNPQWEDEEPTEVELTIKKKG